MTFTIFQVEKTPFQAIKTSTSKSRKIDIFPKWLTHGFGPKMAFFPIFLFGNIGQKNIFYDIGHSSNLFFQEIKARKMSFRIFQNGKSPFQAIKTKTSKSRKIDIFLKELTHGFGPKMAIFRPFFQAIKARKMSFAIFLNEETPFQAIKKRSSKS